MLKFKRVGANCPPFDGKWYLVWVDLYGYASNPHAHPAFVGKYDKDEQGNRVFRSDSGDFTGVTSTDIVGYVEIPQTIEEFETHE